jgi:hypothetical protein
VDGNSNAQTLLREYVKANGVAPTRQTHEQLIQAKPKGKILSIQLKHQGFVQSIGDSFK